MTLKKKDLALKLKNYIYIQTNTTISQDQAQAVITALLLDVAKELSTEGKVDLSDFGKLTTKIRKATTKSHPQRPGEMIEIAEKRVVKFDAYKGLRDQVALPV